MARLVQGLLRPDLLSIEARSVVWTVAFAVLGVGLGAVCGFALAIPYPVLAPVRALATVLRSIHELFWALLLMQVFGLGPATGLLAIALPYIGFFAKVYAEIIEEADLAAVEGLPRGTALLPAFFYARLPDLLPAFRNYTLYRLECGLRSTLVLGFVGLPTIGSTWNPIQAGPLCAGCGAARLLLRPGRDAAALGTPRDAALPGPRQPPRAARGGRRRFGPGEPCARFGHELVPVPLRGHLADAATWAAFLSWLRQILAEQALPGLAETLVLSQIALVATAVLALSAFPLVSRRFAGRFGQVLGRVWLVVVRSTPEYMLAYVLLQLLGPSMLPAILALSLHNAGIVGYLMGRHADALDYRPDAPRGVNLYAFETLPRLYGQFLAYMLYRWEIILRESAIFGILGVATLGYYVDAAISELRFDTALALILAMVLLSAGVHMLSRRLRRALRIDALPTRLSADTYETSRAE